MTTIEQITTENTTVSSNDKTDILLEVKDLTTYFYTEFGVVKAVEGVSFHVNSGEVFGLVGESGKSTLEWVSFGEFLREKKQNSNLKCDICYESVTHCHPRQKISIRRR